MRLRPSALALLALFAACGGGDGGSTDGGSNVCNPTDGGALSCATSPAQSSTAAPTSILFHGEVAVGGSATFKVPLNTASLTVIEQAVDAPDSIVASGATIDNVAVPRLVEVKDASGVTHTLYDDSKDDGAFSGTTTDPTQIEQLPAFFFSDSPSTGTLTLPNTTGGLALVGPQGLPAGQATVVVSDYAYACSSIAGCCGGSNTSTYDVTVIAKPLVSGAIPSQGTLDLNLYFVANKACVPGNTSSCPALSEASAPSDTDLQRMLSTLSYVLGKAGITLGNVNYVDATPKVQTAYANGVSVDSTGACAPLAQLLQTSQGGNAMNLFLVPSINANGLPAGDSVVGVDGTIPGPSTVGGTVASGAIVSVADLRANEASCTGTPVFDPTSGACGADITAYVAAHETGHFLGLYHVTEMSGTEFDPLAGTARCACQSCAPVASRFRCADATPPPPPSTAYAMRAGDCTAVGADVSTGCGGGQDLMFWLLDAGAEGTLTADQQSVIHANPLVY